MNNKNNSMRGFVSIIALILAVLVIGGGSYLVIKKSPEQKAAQIENNVGDIGASVPNLNFSMSPLPDLNVSSLNVSVAGSKVSNIFSAPSVNTDFSYQSNFDFKVPSVSASDFSFQMPTNIPTGSQTSAPSGAGSQPSTGANAPTTDCSAFSGMPDASYCSAAGPMVDVCRKCKGE